MMRTRLSATKRRPSFSDTPTRSRKHRPDYLVLVLMSSLLLCGAIVVYAIGPGLTTGTELGENYYSSKQLTAISLGLVGFMAAAFLPIDRWKKYQFYIITAAVISALAVRFIGEEINGAHRWIQLGGFSFQTAELVKLALVLWLAKFFADKKTSGSLNDPDTFKQLGIVVLAVVFVVAGLQSDLGSAAVMLAIIGLSAFVAGLPLKKMAFAAFILSVLMILAISLSPYRRDRVATFLNPTADCQVEGYQACQALITIGSGGFTGKGLGKSVQAYGYLPEPANDSIFAIVAEKFGFIGAAAVLVVFWTLFRRIAQIAKSASSEYSRLLVNGVLVWLSVQMIINVGAMVGLLPLKGITLPFVSYGGTSIIFVMVAMGIVFQISRYTDLSSTRAGFSSFKNERNSSERAKNVTYRRRI